VTLPEFSCRRPHGRRFIRRASGLRQAGRLGGSHETANPVPELPGKSGPCRERLARLEPSGVSRIAPQIRVEKPIQPIQKELTSRVEKTEFTSVPVTVENPRLGKRNGL